MFPRPCLSCQRIHKDGGDYCTRCRTERNRQRENKPERRLKKKTLYGGDYPRRRAAMVEQTIVYNLPCHICKQNFQRVEDITADHVDATNPNSILLPAHKSCNSSRGNRPLES